MRQKILLGSKVVINPYERTNTILIFDPFHSYFETFILYRYDMWSFQYGRSGIVHQYYTWQIPKPMSSCLIRGGYPPREAL